MATDTSSPSSDWKPRGKGQDGSFVYTKPKAKGGYDVMTIKDGQVEINGEDVSTKGVSGNPFTPSIAPTGPFARSGGPRNNLDSKGTGAKDSDGSDSSSSGGTQTGSPQILKGQGLSAKRDPVSGTTTITKTTKDDQGQTVIQTQFVTKDGVISDISSFSPPVAPAVGSPTTTYSDWTDWGTGTNGQLARSRFKYKDGKMVNTEVQTKVAQPVSGGPNGDGPSALVPAPEEPLKNIKKKLEPPLPLEPKLETGLSTQQKHQPGEVITPTKAKEKPIAVINQSDGYLSKEGNAPAAFVPKAGKDEIKSVKQNLTTGVTTTTLNDDRVYTQAKSGNAYLAKAGNNEESVDWSKPNNNTVLAAGLDPSNVLEQRAATNDPKDVLFKLKNGNFLRYDAQSGKLSSAGTWDSGSGGSGALSLNQGLPVYVDPADPAKPVNKETTIDYSGRQGWSRADQLEGKAYEDTQAQPAPKPEVVVGPTWHANTGWQTPSTNDASQAGLKASQVLEQRPGQDGKTIFRLDDGTYKAYDPATGKTTGAGTWNSSQWDDIAHSGGEAPSPGYIYTTHNGTTGWWSKATLDGKSAQQIADEEVALNSRNQTTTTAMNQGNNWASGVPSEVQIAGYTAQVASSNSNPPAGGHPDGLEPAAVGDSSSPAGDSNAPAWHTNPNWTSPDNNAIAGAGLNASQVLEQRPGQDGKTIFRLEDGTYQAYNPSTGQTSGAGTWDNTEWNTSQYAAQTGLSVPAPEPPPAPQPYYDDSWMYGYQAPAPQPTPQAYSGPSPEELERQRLAENAAVAAASAGYDDSWMWGGYTPPPPVSGPAAPAEEKKPEETQPPPGEIGFDPSAAAGGRWWEY